MPWVIKWLCWHTLFIKLQAHRDASIKKKTWRAKSAWRTKLISMLPYMNSCHIHRGPLCWSVGCLFILTDKKFSCHRSDVLRALCVLAANPRSSDVTPASAPTLQTTQAPASVVTMANAVRLIKRLLHSKRCNYTQHHGGFSAKGT